MTTVDYGLSMELGKCVLVKSWHQDLYTMSNVNGIRNNAQVHLTYTKYRSIESWWIDQHSGTLVANELASCKGNFTLALQKNGEKNWFRVLNL